MHPWLPSLASALSSASPAVRSLLEALISDDARTRTRGLDDISAVLGPAAQHPHAIEALPHLFELATQRAYPGASAVLVRLFAIAARFDDPPRSKPDETTRAVHALYRAQLPRLIRHVQTARDPAAARIAASIAARFPEADLELERLLVALLSGTDDPDERGRLLYGLTRIQASRGARFHPRVAEAIHRSELDPEKVAVAMALAEHEPPEPLRGQLAEALEEARQSAGRSDPRSWGRVLDREALDRCLGLLRRA